MSKKKNIFFFTQLFAFLLLPVLAYAQGPIIPCDGIHCTVKDLITMLVNIYNLIIGFAGSVALIFIIYGGVRMLYWSYMEEAPRELEDAKRTVSRAVTGFVIVLAAYLIVNTLLSFFGITGGPGSFIQDIMG